MIRIIDGVVFEGKSVDSVRMKVHDLGNGHMEITGVREVHWQEQDWSPYAIQCYREAVQRCRDENPNYDEERRAKMLSMAAARARKRVRRICKVMGVDTLLTLTYRANIVDLGRCKRNLKEFVRRLRRVLPDFRAVACFEKQKRGAWHVHLATIRFPATLAAVNGVKVKSFNVIRAIWRSVTGEDGGNVDISNTKRGAQRSAAKIAAYIAKYISKAFAEGDAGSNRWTRFGDCDLPKPIDMGTFPNMLAVVEAAYAIIDTDVTIEDQHVSRWRDWFYIVVEKPQP